MSSSVLPRPLALEQRGQHVWRIIQAALKRDVCRRARHRRRESSHPLRAVGARMPQSRQPDLID